MHDPKVFEDPMEFKPERFMKDGELDPSVLDPDAAAFDFGRR
jgi:cytochrome P450